MAARAAGLPEGPAQAPGNAAMTLGDAASAPGNAAQQPEDIMAVLISLRRQQEELSQRMEAMRASRKSSRKSSKKGSGLGHFIGIENGES